MILILLIVSNLYFKVGNFVDISFDSEEKVLIREDPGTEVETFDATHGEGLLAAEELLPVSARIEKEEDQG